MLYRLLREKGTPITMKVNKLLMPIYHIPITVEGAKEFNTLYKELLDIGWNTIVRTPSGGVSIARKNFNPPMWDVKYNSNCVELTIVSTYMLRVQFRTIMKKDGEQTIYGRQAFTEFKRMLVAAGINLDDYKIDNGEEVKKTIDKYLIRLERDIWKDVTLEGCHHLDFHNSFPAGLANTHPEFRPVIEKLYNERKNKPINKAILNLSIGFLQSIGGCGARWAHLSRDAIHDNNVRLEELANRLKESGRTVLLWNTDGIWYKGPVYHGDGEGSRLGEWENDHIDCTLRIKSKGAYEFIEDGKYYPVLRGATKLDEVKPREEWVWGDIYNRDAKVIQFEFTEGIGLTYIGGIEL